jgi:membrane protein implicated in regulation of membrane protease activity
MSDSTFWWLLAGLAVAIELVTGTFYLLMLGIGLVAGALAAHAGVGLTGQIVAAALVGTLALLGWNAWRRQHHAPAPAAANQDVNLDIGQTVQVDHWQADATAHVHYRGADWTVELASTGTTAPTPGRHRIVAVQGSRLIVQAF